MDYPEFEKAGFGPADILVPQNCDMRKWSVVACDQYTSQPEYWSDVAKIVGDAPSAYRLMLPEAYLGAPDEQARIDAINAAMRHYLQRGVFRTLERSFVYVERRLHGGRVRRGLVGAVDLECYDYRSGSTSLVRATEGTVLERIPPRVRVRRNAPLEMPHVMLLIDDPKDAVMTRAAQALEKAEKLYDFDLMKDGGHLRGWRISGEALGGIAQALSELAGQEAFDRKYGLSGRPVMAIAVGDGNHSLATAKQCYEELKQRLPEEEAKRHPARYALAELVNIHDPALEFEPIHRVVFDVEPKALIEAFRRYYPQDGGRPGRQIAYLYAGGRGSLACPGEGLVVGLLQNFLDDYTSRHGGRIDYIHGEEVVRALSARPGCVGFLVPAMGKSELFRAVITNGVLPRKTFSMGEACDKRFYLECRKIR